MRKRLWLVMRVGGGTIVFIFQPTEESEMKQASYPWHPQLQCRHGVSCSMESKRLQVVSLAMSWTLSGGALTISLKLTRLTTVRETEWIYLVCTKRRRDSFFHHGSNDERYLVVNPPSDRIPNMEVHARPCRIHDPSGRRSMVEPTN